MGGSTSTTQSYSPAMNFEPVTTGGGAITFGNQELAQSSLSLQNLESYDEFMPAWTFEAKAKMDAAAQNGQRSADQGVQTTHTESHSSSSSLMDLATVTIKPARVPPRVSNMAGNFAGAKNLVTK